MKKHFKILFFVAPVILVAAAFLIKVSSAALLDIRISPVNPERTLCTNKTAGTQSISAGCDESQNSRIACKGAGDILCTYQGGWKMCFENKGDYASKEEVCARSTVTVGGQAAPPISAEFSSLLEENSYCSNAGISKKSICRGAEAALYIACAGENDKICKQDTNLGCTQFDNCKDLMGTITAQEETNTVWAKFDGKGAALIDGKCKKALVTGDGTLISKTYTSKQECESAVTPSPSPSPSPSPATMQACGMSGKYWRMSDSSCQPQSNCWDTAHADYNIQECQGVRRGNPGSQPPPPPPPPPPSSTSQCPRKPDPAKGTAEPDARPDGYEIKEVPSYYLWGCYSQPDKTNASCTPQASKRTGNATSPCVYGEESINGPSKGIAYLDGNFLKWAPLKKIAGGKDEGKKDDKTPEPVTITRTVERIVTVEVPSTTSIVPLEVVTAESCKRYYEEVDEKVATPNDTYLNAADAAFKSTAVNNPAFKKAFYDIMNESAKKSHKIRKLVNAKTCSAESVGQTYATVKDFESNNIEKVKQALSFLDKTTQVQNQYVGINECVQGIEKFAKLLKPGEEKLFAEELGSFEQIKTDFQDILDAEKGGKVFGFEIEASALQCKELTKSIEKKSSQISGEKKNASVKQGSVGAKKTVKKKSAKKSAKKTTKKIRSSSKK